MADNFDDFDDDYDYEGGDCEDLSGPTCPACGSSRTSIEGAASDGDGDLYDEAMCCDCGETFPDPSSYIWIANDGATFDDEDDMHQWNAMLAEEEGGHAT